MEGLKEIKKNMEKH